ncbi:hypothetical protein [Bacillus sp. 1P06AnD]|uniref:hypothetical protein n=1 Tax=Bacillus sp. 1P06AnD TaxID=3132208 RepID=UPI00399FAB86
MKRTCMYFICLVGAFTILAGCSNKAEEQPAFNNGVVDKNYKGDPDPVLEENYKQTPEEAKQLEDLKKSLEDNDTKEAEERLHRL